jgi:serine/threonine-protein kinase RsbW
VTNVGWLITATVPARAAHIQLLRTIVAGVGAGAGLTYDEIDDLRLAVQEAAGQILLVTAPDSSISLRMDRDDADVLRVELSTGSVVGRWPPLGIEESLAWSILTTLVDDVTVGRADGDGAWLRLTQPGAGAVAGPAGAS